MELAHIFRLYAQAYLEKYGLKMPSFHLRAFRDIMLCRTQAMGGKTFFCDHCQKYHYSYHSCGNRNCNKCQNDLAQQWLENAKQLLLPVSHFLLTFTLPAEFRTFARKMQKLFYSLLLKTAAEALQTLANDPKFVGGKLGILAVLHTWRRDLSYHPHVHMVVPGGGISKNKNLWLPAQNKFLVPVRALSPILRAKFRDALEKENPDIFALIPQTVWRKNWVIHCKPVGNGQAVLKYLAQYIFRPAISNNRILKCEDDRVTFKYQDAKSKTWKIRTLPAMDFISAYLQHALPKGFVKVRYYGFLAHKHRETLAMLRTQLATHEQYQPDIEPEPKKKIISCPTCGKPLRFVKEIRRGEQWINAPPDPLTITIHTMFEKVLRSQKILFS